MPEDASSTRLNRVGERIASVVILLMLLAIGLSVILEGRSGTNTGPILIGMTSGEGHSLPPTLLAGYRLRSIATYDASTLYEYINGRAPRFVDFGFKGLTVAEYASGDAAPTVIVDVYDMGQRRNAYGIFMDEFPPEEEPAALGNGGFVSGNLAVFWKGTSYIRVSAPTETDMEDIVRQSAEALAQTIDDESAELKEFSAFPTDGLAAGSEVYVKSAALGLEYLRETFLADYESADGSYRLLLCDVERKEDALKILKGHEAFLRAGGSVDEASYDGDENIVAGLEKYIGPVVLLSRENLVAGCAGLDNRAVAEQKARDLLARAMDMLRQSGGE